MSGGPCICEDTSLCIHALGGMPGPFIKFFQTSLGNNGLYKILEAYEDKSATAGERAFVSMTFVFRISFWF